METRTFRIGAIISVTHEILLCDISGIYELLNFITGENLFTHQLPRAVEHCKEHILNQCPELRGLSVKHVNRENWQNFIVDVEAELGPTRDLCPLAAGEQINVDPLEELQNMIADRSTARTH